MRVLNAWKFCLIYTSGHNWLVTIRCTLNMATANWVLFGTTALGRCIHNVLIHNLLPLLNKSSFISCAYCGLQSLRTLYFDLFGFQANLNSLDHLLKDFYLTCLFLKLFLMLGLSFSLEFFEAQLQNTKLIGKLFILLNKLADIFKSKV